MSIPVYKLQINPDDDTGVKFVALVDAPAIEQDWLAFSKNQPHQFKASSEAQRIVSGPLMIADLPIYRNNEDYGEHYVVFDAATIEQIVLKFFRNSFTANVNMMHEPDLKTEGVYMFESFIIDSAKGKPTPEGFAKLADGSWFGSYKVDNDLVWDEFVKTGIFKGFSVEGLFKYGPQRSAEEEMLNSIINVLQQVA